jgi:hypothetical protein
LTKRLVLHDNTRTAETNPAIPSVSSQELA